MYLKHVRTRSNEINENKSNDMKLIKCNANSKIKRTTKVREIQEIITLRMKGKGKKSKEKKRKEGTRNKESTEMKMNRR
jgi:predicted transcriptional regulator